MLTQLLHFMLLLLLQSCAANLSGDWLFLTGG
jgi:hypothetical protein